MDDFYVNDFWDSAQSNDDDWFDDRAANDDYIYGKGFSNTYFEPDPVDWKAKGW